MAKTRPKEVVTAGEFGLHPPLVLSSFLYESFFCFLRVIGYYTAKSEDSPSEIPSSIVKRCDSRGVLRVDSKFTTPLPHT